MSILNLLAAVLCGLCIICRQLVYRKLVGATEKLKPNKMGIKGFIILLRNLKYYALLTHDVYLKTATTASSGAVL